MTPELARRHNTEQIQRLPEAIRRADEGLARALDERDQADAKITIARTFRGALVKELVDRLNDHLKHNGGVL